MNFLQANTNNPKFQLITSERISQSSISEDSAHEEMHSLLCSAEREYINEQVKEIQEVQEFSPQKWQFFKKITTSCTLGLFNAALMMGLSNLTGAIVVRLSDSLLNMEYFEFLNDYHDLTDAFLSGVGEGAYFKTCGNLLLIFFIFKHYGIFCYKKNQQNKPRSVVTNKRQLQLQALQQELHKIQQRLQTLEKTSQTTAADETYKILCSDHAEIIKQAVGLAMESIEASEIKKVFKMINENNKEYGKALLELREQNTKNQLATSQFCEKITYSMQEARAELQMLKKKIMETEKMFQTVQQKTQQAEAESLMRKQEATYTKVELQTLQREMAKIKANNDPEGTGSQVTGFYCRL